MLDHRRFLAAMLDLALVAGCGGGQTEPGVPQAPSATTSMPSSVQAPASSGSAASSSSTGTAPAANSAPSSQAPTRATPILRFTEGLATPESVLYDESADRYLVSNINGKPLDVDDNGYIAELSPDGKVVKAKFIAGGVNKVKLDAPKGSAISRGVLYVADITVVRKFDLKTGAPKGSIAIAGATFLNDVSALPDGRVFVSDSGLKAGKDGLEPTGSDAVYVIEPGGRVRALAKSKELGSPNGVLATDQGVLVVTFGSNELYRLDDKGKRTDVTRLPEGRLDGIVPLGDVLFVSSWQGSAVYRGQLGGKFELVIAGVTSPADIGLDTKRRRLLIPRFNDSIVEVYQAP